MMTQASLGWLLLMSAIPYAVVIGAPRLTGLTRGEAKTVGYNLVCVSTNVLMASIGCRAWWFDAHMLELRGDHAPSSRVYAGVSAAETLLDVALAYELWNTLASVVLERYRTAAYLAHHSVTFCLAVLATHPFLHYYVVFFLGAPSISSAFLGALDVLDDVPALQHAMPRLSFLVRLGFALTFLCMRSLLWPVISFYFWCDSLAVLDGEVHSRWAFYFYLVSNLFLTALQVVWTGRVVQNVMETLHKLRDE